MFPVAEIPKPRYTKKDAGDYAVCGGALSGMRLLVHKTAQKRG